MNADEQRTSSRASHARQDAETTASFRAHGGENAAVNADERSSIELGLDHRGDLA